jgi:hemolysin III
MVSRPLIAQGYSLAEEVANSISHGIGLVFGIVGLVLLLVQAVDTNASAMAITSYSLYGGSMILLFLASTLYHAIPHQRAKIWLKKFDHCAIYLIIGGYLYAVFAGGAQLTAVAWPDDCDLEPGAAGDPV